MKKIYNKPQTLVHVLAMENQILAISPKPDPNPRMKYDLGDQSSVDQHLNKDVIIGGDDDEVL